MSSKFTVHLNTELLLRDFPGGSHSLYGSNEITKYFTLVDGNGNTVEKVRLQTGDSAYFTCIGNSDRASCYIVNFALKASGLSTKFGLRFDSYVSSPAQAYSGNNIDGRWPDGFSPYDGYYPVSHDMDNATALATPALWIDAREPMEATPFLLGFKVWNDSTQQWVTYAYDPTLQITT